MKKIFGVICTILLVCVTMLSGCNLVTTNVDSYYTAIVAEFGSMKIAKKDFINAYNSNASTYTQQGKTNTEAAVEVVNDLIDRNLLIEYAKENYGIISLTKAEYDELSAQEKANYTLSAYGLYVNNNMYYDYNTAIKDV